MGEKLTLGMKGRLMLSVDGSPANRPLDVAIEGLELDLDRLMAEGKLTMGEDDTKVRVTLEGVTLGFTLDAREVLSRGADAMLHGIEEDIR